MGDRDGHSCATIFDRFETDENAGPERLATDLADILGGRRFFSARDLGVLSWGMPSMSNITSRSGPDRQQVAKYIADTLDRFEPRLEDVRVTPMEDVADFQFRIEARLVEDESPALTLRILAPQIGGGLGAKVMVLDIRKSDVSSRR